MDSPFVQANTNGRLHPGAEPSVAPINRGFLYGDAVYEVWRSYHGVVYAWEEHWRRLLASAAALRLEVPFAPAAMLEEIRRTAAAHRAASEWRGEVYIRLQVTRGGGPIGLDTVLADRPDFVLLVQRCPENPPEKARTGLRLSIATTLRRNSPASLDPAWKTGNYLNNLLGLREARARGADDVVLLNLAGEVAEASTSNIAFVRDGALVTPPLAAGILGGITRSAVLGQVAPALGVPAGEAVVRPEDLSGMGECLLLSTTKDIVPVASIDAQRFSVGPETVTAHLKAAFAGFVRAYAERRPDLRIL